PIPEPGRVPGAASIPGAPAEPNPPGAAGGGGAGIRCCRSRRAPADCPEPLASPGAGKSCGSTARPGLRTGPDSLLPNPQTSPTEPSESAMDEWDLPQWKKEVESLKYQLAYKREMSSKTIPEFVKWIEDGIPEDPFLNPELMKNNPWVEKGKCIIL
uniref:G protein subunit gamma 13 n=48 Tax=Telluraves TaxID=3073808 RepID=A0A674GYM5_TAEGU